MKVAKLPFLGPVMTSDPSIYEAVTGGFELLPLLKFQGASTEGADLACSAALSVNGSTVAYSFSCFQVVLKNKQICNVNAKYLAASSIV